jgi:putative ABC transport system permease protein
MVSIRAVERTKEIGIRKVLGARVHHIINLLTRALLVQISVSTLLGIPVSFWLVRLYLDRFDDKFLFSWWHYLLPVVAFLLIIVLTVTSVVIRATRTNPADSLRTE